MKGFYIYEVESRIGTVVDCLELGSIDNTFTHEFTPGTMTEEVKIHALVSKGTKSKCSKDDTYDFETGALIALMKMCGVDKVVRACNEAFSEEMYNTYITKFEGELHELKKNFDKVKDLKDFYKKNYEDLKEHYDKLGDRNKYLLEDINKKLGYLKEKDEEIEKLKSDKDKSWKKHQRNIQKKQDRINELERAYKASNDDEAKLVEYYQREIKKLEAENEKLKKNINELFESDKYSKSLVGRLSFEKHHLEEENEKLQHEYNLCLNSENALKYTTDSLNKSVAKLNKAIEGYKNDLYNTAKRCKELEEENEKLKLDCEKLQHGYIDTDIPLNHWDGDIRDMVFLPGRCCGKQHKALVELFKKTDQKKVDAAYKEAYGSRVIWCSSQSSTRDMLDSLIGSCKYAILTDKDCGQIEKWTGISEFTWEIKVPTKREEMWNDILKEGRTPVYVKREDIHDFLKECQATGIKWATGKLPLETMPFHMSKGYDGIYFFVMTSLDISKSTPGSKEFRHVMCWWMTASDEEARNSVKYLPPMRWDLFKKGRLAVKVNYDNYKEFYEACEKELGKKPVAMIIGDFTVSISKKDSSFEVRSIIDQKKTGKKIVDWEDVK